MSHLVTAEGRVARRRACFLAVLGALLIALPAVRGASSFRASAAPAPPPGGFFDTLPPGTVLPSDSACASRVQRSSWEPRPENAVANATVPGAISLPGFTPDDGGTNLRARALADRVSGNFKGTTDEIIQWAACKWGFSDETVRAQAVSESGWYQSTTGDETQSQASCQPGYLAPCPQSFGILQVKATVWRNTFPLSRDSTAFNLDYALMVHRVCFEGWVDWLYHYPGGSAPYRSGDASGCMGFWSSGTWYGHGAQSYIDRVGQHLAAKPWRTWPDRSAGAPAAGSVTLTTPATAQPGTRITVGWSAPAGQATPRDWIGLFRAGAPATAHLEWHYTAGAPTGTMSFTAPPEGSYEFRYFVNDSYTVVGTSAPLTVSATPAPVSGSALLMAPTSARAGAPVLVNWWANTVQATPKDWIALFRTGAASTDFLEWHYTGGGPSGTMAFTAPGPGTYEFRYLVNDSYTAAAKSRALTVT